MNAYEHTLLETIRDNTEYVRDRVDSLDRDVTKLRVSVEHRVTRLEAKAALIALIISAAVSFATAAFVR